MTDTAAPEHVLDRLEKLLRMAESPNEHEAAVAMSKAQQIMDDFNIDAATLGKSAKGKQGAPRKDEKSKGGLYGWQRDLWKAVAEMNFCRYWSIKGLGKGSVYEHRLLGSTVNVKSTQIMANYLQQAVERLAKDEAKLRGVNVFCSDMIGFREGIADRVVERLQALRQERIREADRKKREDAARASHPGSAGSSTALVLSDVMQSEEDLNNDHLHGWEPGTTARRRMEDEQKRQMDAAKRRLWATDKAEFARVYGDEEAAKMRAAEIKQAKYDADVELYYAGKHSDTFGPGLKKSRPSRSSGVERYRQPTGREARKYGSSYREGRAKGDTVGLDQQVGHDGRNKLS